MEFNSPPADGRGACNVFSHPSRGRKAKKEPWNRKIPGFSLAAGEVVTIKATYTPFNASVDFGLIAPDGLFYGLSGSNGSFDEGIQVNQNGVYRLAIRNRSSVAVDVSGYVNY